ncbi:DUF305 domain-containing protein [Mycolicibacterium thermoresistibile]
MTTITARIVAVFAALATALFLSACSGTDTDPAAEGPADTQTTEYEAAPFNDADIAFATDMIPHHQQALELSALVPERSDDPEVTELAAAISAAQEPEILAMRAWLLQWDAMPEGGEPGQHADHSDMPGMVDEATMTRLESLSGAEFDTLWLQSMIAHHEGAVEMAETELADGENVDAKHLAQQIIDTQQAEIDQMQQMLEARS